MTTSDAQERARANRRETSGPRREELLSAAAACFDELGYTATTVELIAARAQTSRPTFYAYFRSKDEVLLAVTEQVCAELESTQQLEEIESLPPVTVLRSTTRAFAETIFAHGSLVALIDSRAGVDPDVDELWTTLRRRLERRFTQYLSGLDPATIDPCVQPERLVSMLSDSIVRGAARLGRATDEVREQFINDQIRLTERAIGVTDDALPEP
ncbi:TetR/AcrR family transcriptional regulator [Saccharopolyspora sp. TS4A08]|uniref:TetR/AcrR family transcriptional regulator n=1 Tax=Saccharopolyspora ipomoeae TaxID=3042027 RepID=A0ABT6PIA4_9PSEU|nr:TetR/AcrR family transcriptional regulator [Saccharopolyspora sp. TS4A08]MDI2027725.1 TetR/AcrR family transcriptional regulator [Saccharopolyspora sp. TS4A08]